MNECVPSSSHPPTLSEDTGWQKLADAYQTVYDATDPSQQILALLTRVNAKLDQLLRKD